MRMFNIIQIALEYAVPGILAAACILVLGIFGYLVVYKKICHGSKKPKFGTVAGSAMLLIYLVIVLGATLGIRSGVVSSKLNLRLFESYMEAWCSFTAISWRQLILNIMMFIPIGFLLPLTFTRFRVWWRTYLAGFLFSLAIEMVQYLTKRGIAEIDDLFNNTMGVLVGYGLALFVLAIFQKLRQKNKSIKPGHLVAAQIPLMLTLAGFSIIFILYNRKDLGNLSLMFERGSIPGQVILEDGLKLSDEESKGMVYKTEILTKQQAYAYAAEIFEQLGCGSEFEVQDVYDDCVVYRSKNGENSLWVYYLGGTSWYTNFRNMDDQKNQTGLTNTQVRAALEQAGYSVPEKAEFKEREGEYVFTCHMLQVGDVLYEGSLSCSIQGTISFVHDTMVRCNGYKEFTLISPQQALANLEAGKSDFYELDGMTLRFNHAELVYETDTKGYLQPVWSFSERKIHKDTQNRIEIPAVKNGW